MIKERNLLLDSLIIEDKIHWWTKYLSISLRKNVPSTWRTVQPYDTPSTRRQPPAQTFSPPLQTSVSQSCQRNSTIKPLSYLPTLSWTMMTMQQMMKRRWGRWRRRCTWIIWWPRYRIRLSRRWRQTGYTNRLYRYKRWSRNRGERGNCLKKRRNSGRLSLKN